MRIFYQSPVSYDWIRQRPQEIADGLAARGHQVFWFYAGSFHKTRFRRFDGKNGIFGLELPVFPFASRCRLIERLNHLWVSWWLRRESADAVVVTNPVAVPWLPKSLVTGRTIYDCMDVQTAFFTGRRRRRMQETERQVANTACRLIASSSVIRDKLVSDYGVDPERISVLPNGVTMQRETHEDALVEVGHPSIAYFGTISSWFDWKSVLAAARMHPEWDFDLFGPRDGATVPLPRNVRLRGALPHAKVLAQAKSSDVLIMPFVRNEVIEGVDPVKMYEYLAVGRPIVSSWWPLLEKFKAFPAISFYTKASEFAERICAALARKEQYPVPLEFLDSCSWSRRIADFEQILMEGVRD